MLGHEPQPINYANAEDMNRKHLSTQTRAIEYETRTDFAVLVVVVVVAIVAVIIIVIVVILRVAMYAE